MQLQLHNAICKSFPSNPNGLSPEISVSHYKNPNKMAHLLLFLLCCFSPWSLQATRSPVSLWYIFLFRGWLLISSHENSSQSNSFSGLRPLCLSSTATRAWLKCRLHGLPWTMKGIPLLQKKQFPIAERLFLQRSSFRLSKCGKAIYRWCHTDISLVKEKLQN